MAATVTKDMLIGEILQIDGGTVPILTEAGMHCLGCPASQMEPLEDAYAVHGIHPDIMEKQLNDYLKNK